MAGFLEKLLDYYKLSKEDYACLNLPVGKHNFLVDHTFDTKEIAVQLTKEVMANKGKIIIYGDFDADGVMSISILVKLFEYLKYPVDYYMPSRYLDGYGINVTKAQEIIDKHYDMVIIVDNGISAFIPVEMLHNAGIKVLILDHHEMQENKLPMAEAIMHPTISHYGDIASSGAFTAFIYSSYMLGGKMDKYLSLLASISLITDVMPMKGYNRDLVRLMTDKYQKGEFLAVDLLLNDKPFSYESIGRDIGPKINAIGRVIEDTSIKNIIEYFTKYQGSDLLSYNNYINEINDIKKNLINEISKQEIVLKENEPLILIQDNIKLGLMSIVASSLNGKYHVPVIILSKEDEFTFRASARSEGDFDLFKALTSLKISYTSFGGHAQAVGFSLKISDYDEFSRQFKEYYAKNPMKYEEDSIEISLLDINFDNLKTLQTFAPFGQEWSEPLFLIKHVKSDTFSFIGAKSNTIVKRIGYSAKIIGFNIDKEQLSDKPFIDIYGHISLNSYQGRKEVQFCISKYQKSKV